SHDIKPLAGFPCGEWQCGFQCAQSMLGIIGNKNDSAQRFWLRFRLGEEHDRTAGFTHKAARDIAKKWMQHDLLFERAGDDHVDLLPAERAENGFGWVACFVMNRCIDWKLQLRERISKRLCRFLIACAHINQMELRRKRVPNSLRFGNYLSKPRGKRAGDSNRAVTR